MGLITELFGGHHDITIEPLQPRAEVPLHVLQSPFWTDRLAPDERYATQPEWIARHNRENDVMASPADIYHAVQRAPSFAREFQEFFPIGEYRVGRDRVEHVGLLTGARVYYAREGIDATLVDYANSKVARPRIRKLPVPEFPYAKLVDVLRDPLGLAYLHTLFNTEDTPLDIAHTLETLGNRKLDDIAVCTSNADERAWGARAVVSFDYNTSMFVIDAIFCPQSRGTSRALSTLPKPHGTEAPS